MNCFGLIVFESLAIGCADRSPAIEPPSRAPISNAAAPTGDTTMLPLPEEPWYRDKAEQRDDCVEPLPAIPPRHFPQPFDTCDPQAESYSSPAGSGELHFHYRFFSVALTQARRLETDRAHEPAHPRSHRT